MQVLQRHVVGGMAIQRLLLRITGALPNRTARSSTNTLSPTEGFDTAY